MLSRRDDPFPFEAVRDLLGIVRAMYVAARARRASRAELAKIAAIGRELSEAIELAVSSREGTVGSRAAWALVDALTPAEPLVVAALGRVTGVKAMKRKAPFDR
jgi:hypothetical protein